MTASFSTRGIPSRERVHYWVEVATRAYVVHDFVSLSGPSFHAEVRGGPIGGMGVSVFKSDPCKVIRSARDVARDDADDILLTLQLTGQGCFEQDGCQTITEPGDIVLVDASRPSTGLFADAMSTITFKLSRADIALRLGDPKDLAVRKIAAKDALGSLVSRFLVMLPQHLDRIDAPADAQLSTQALDLVALAFSAQVGISGPPQAAQRATALFRLKSVIEVNLRDHTLKPSGIAAKVGLSVRYANDLLSRDGFSLERYLLHRRLERCRHALEDRTQAHRKVGEIAFGWGFSDPSHFARRFRDAYGMTPGEWRRRALVETADCDLLLSR